MIGRILTITFFILLVSDIYIFTLFIRKLIKNLFLRILWFVPSVILLGGICYFFYSGVRNDYRDFFTIVFMALALPKIFFFIISLLDLPLRYFFKWKVYPFTIIGLIACFGVEYIVIYGSTSGKTRFEVKEIELYSSGLPSSFDGYKLAQISDMHMAKWKEDKASIQKMVEMIDGRQVDAVMITGDLVHNSTDELDGFDDILSSIKAPDGVYSILGNHDYGLYKRWENKERQRLNLEYLKERQAAMGWHLLNNQHVFLKRGNDSIALIGVENDGKPPFPKYGDLKQAMRGTERQRFKILLSHDPTHWRREVLGTDIDLMLSGHTHGTQFALLGFSPASFFYREWWGLYEEGGRSLYVNAGIGTAIIPFRFGAWPEITVITLRKR